MIRLLLIRHGETEWNREGRYHGHTDIELNKTGMEQARRLGQRLSHENIDAIYSSSLTRAIQTAQHISEAHDLSVIGCDELKELNLGDFEGKWFKESGDNGRSLETAWENGDVDFPIPGGETLYELQSRVSGFLSELLERHDSGTLALVAHGGSLRIALCHLIGIDLKCWWRLQLSSTSLSIVNTYPDHTILSLLNDTCHLLSCYPPAIERDVPTQSPMERM